MSGVDVRRTILLRRPPVQVWSALRDRLEEVAGHMAGIESVRCVGREEEGPGVLRTVNEWRATTALPAFLKQRVEEGALVWTERARLDSDALESRWTVESRLLGDGLAAQGTTRLAPAMGGHGTRLEFEVTATLAPGALGALDRGRIHDGLREASAMVVAKTLQDLAIGVDALLASEQEERS